MFEEAVYDEQGSLLTSSLADYLIPTAADPPVLRDGHDGDPD